MQKQEDQAIQKTVVQINAKLKQIQAKNIHPPYFPKYLTKYREEYYESLKKELKLYLNNTASKIVVSGKDSLRVAKCIRQFIQKFDEKYVDTYLEELRQPYIRKMFQENYGFDDVDFRHANNEFHLKSEIENALTQASEWLLQVELTQDLLNRVQLYFGIKTPALIERLKKEGMQSGKGSWMDAFTSSFKNISTYALRKSSKVVSANLFTAMAPAAAMISFAIMGGTATLPWKTDLNLNAFLPALVVLVVPFMLDSMAEGIEKNQMYGILQKWAMSFQKMSANIRKYNEFLQQAIKTCVSASTSERFEIEYTNLQKYIAELGKNLDSIENESQSKFDEMRERTEAYFRQYIEVKEGDWTIVYPKEGQEQGRTNKDTSH